MSPPACGCDGDRLRHLYECEQMSTYRIAALVGTSRARVTRILRRAGVSMRPRGAGGRRPRRRAPEPADLPELLEELYHGRQLSSREVADRVRMPERAVRHRLAEHGIPRRPPGNRDPAARPLLDPDTLSRLYGDRELPAARVAELLKVSRIRVARDIHEWGLPVRFGTCRRDSEEIRLIEALYADEQTAEALRRHGVPVVPAGRPLWERFGKPVPLSTELLTDLYTGCGLATGHISLLTGHPAASVARALRRIGIALRPPGGRSPFLRRYRRRTP
jgi:hypothetical protein